MDLVRRPDFNTSGVFYARYYKDNPYQDPEVGWRKLRDDVMICGNVSSTNANRVDIASIREVFSISKSNTTHCGGWMGYGKAEVTKIKKEIEMINFPWGEANEISSFAESNDGEIYLCEYKKDGRGRSRTGG
jgi:hypothetical protein